MGKQITIGDQPLVLQEFSGYKAFAAMECLKAIFRAGPEIDKRVSSYRREYEADNYVTLDRVTALHRFGQAELGHLTDADWQANGNQLRLPTSPTGAEIAVAAFPIALEIAKAESIRLLGLLALSNRDLEEADVAGGEAQVNSDIDARAKRLLHEARADQLLELAVASVELLEGQFDETVRGLGDRLGNALRLLGLGKNPAEPEQPTTEPEASTPPASSSTNSDPDTAGTSAPPSIEPVGDGSPSYAT